MHLPGIPLQNIYTWLSFLRPLIGSEALNYFLLTWSYAAVHRKLTEANTSYMQFSCCLWPLVRFRSTERMTKNKRGSRIWGENMKATHIGAVSGADGACGRAAQRRLLWSSLAVGTSLEYVMIAGCSQDGDLGQVNWPVGGWSPQEPLKGLIQFVINTMCMKDSNIWYSGN